MIQGMNEPGVSVIIPTRSLANDLMISLESVCKSVESFTGPKELIICIDRPMIFQDPIEVLADDYPFIRILQTDRRMGESYARKLAVEKSKYRTLAFTDDDCWVQPNWLTRLYDLTQQYGAVTGLITGRGNTLIDRCESLIDTYRVRAKDSNGKNKFFAFANFGIQRELLAAAQFDVKYKHNLGSLDTGNQLRLLGKYFIAREDIIVATKYPSTVWEAVNRKLRHAKGIAYVHHRLGHKAWQQLEIGGHFEIIVRWTKISFAAPMNLQERLFFFFLNMCYAIPLVYYYYLGFLTFESNDS